MTHTKEAASSLFDVIKQRMGYKYDASLARGLEIAPSFISAARVGRLLIGDSIILKIHDLTEMPIREIKGMLGLRCLDTWHAIH